MRSKLIIFLSAVLIIALCSCRVTENPEITPPIITDSYQEVPFEETLADGVEITVNTDKFLIMKYISDINDSGIQKTVIDYSKGCHEGFIVYGEFEISKVVKGKFSPVYKYGYMDKFFNIVIPAQFDTVNVFKNGIAVVKTLEGYNVIDTLGNYVLSDMADNKLIIIGNEIIERENIDQNSWLIYFYDAKTGISNRVLKIAYEPTEHNYRVSEMQDNGVFVISEVEHAITDIRLIYQDIESNLWGFTDGLGRVVCEATFDAVFPFSEDKAVVEADGKFGYIDSKGKLVIDCIYSNASDFNDEIACVSMNNKFGYISESGFDLIECKYTVAKPFYNGYAAVTDDGSYWYFIDETGEKVTDELYVMAGNFYSGYAPVELKNSSQFTYIDSTGAIIYEGADFDRAYDFDNEGIAFAMNQFIVSNSSTSSTIEAVSIIQIRH